MTKPELPARITVTDAIDHAGRVLFGDDWIGSLKPRDLAILQQHGPRRGAGANAQIIDPCSGPESLRRDLDRAIGRHQRSGAQRSTVLEWFYQNRIAFDSAVAHVDAKGLALALAAFHAAPPQSVIAVRKRGRPDDKKQAVVAAMMATLDSGIVTKSELQAMKPDHMRAKFGASRKTCTEARELALKGHAAISGN
jgi:hypothetical protein